MNEFKFNIPVFLIALSIGILYIYISKPAIKVIMKYPTPDNCGKIKYRDKANNCFEFAYEKVNCPSDGSAKSHPIIT
jgi:hypothetical protein